MSGSDNRKSGRVQCARKMKKGERHITISERVRSDTRLIPLMQCQEEQEEGGDRQEDHHRGD